MTREALQRVRTLLGEIDDIIYKNARDRATYLDAKGRVPEDFTYTEDEVTLSTIIDEALGQTTKMIEGAV